MTPDQIKQLHIANFEKQAKQIVWDSFENLGIPDDAKNNLTYAVTSAYKKGWEAREEYIPLSRAKPPYEKPVLVIGIINFQKK